MAAVPAPAPVDSATLGDPLTPAAPPQKVEDLSAGARYASICIREGLAETQKKIPALPTPTGNDVPQGLARNAIVPIGETLSEGDDTQKSFGVCIIGAGTAGLFTAMIFDHLREKFGLEVNYKILEANKEERLGGRLFSYYFKDGLDAGKHAYFDVGAMRFPEIKVMHRTFELFKTLDMNKNYDKDPPLGSIIPYYLYAKDNNAPLYYNDRYLVSEKATARKFGLTGLPENMMDRNPGDVFAEAVKKYTDMYIPSPEKFWDAMINEADKYSVRTYLADVCGYDYNTIQFLETFNYADRLYDQGLVQAILEQLDFGTQPDNPTGDTNDAQPPASNVNGANGANGADGVKETPNPGDGQPPWWCVEGGVQQIALRMRAQIEKTKKVVHFNQKVSAMRKSLVAPNHIGGQHTLRETIEVTVEKGKTESYDAVFNSAPLGAMQRIDLQGMNLNWETKTAIRSLGYNPSCKVGIHFKNMWWIKELGIFGGYSKTDLPIRICVYPSYNLYDPPENPGALLVSYSQSQEALRIGSLISKHSPDNESELKRVLIHDLSWLHWNPKGSKTFQQIYDMINDAYDTHFGFSWQDDPTVSGGSVAYFGPSQFSKLYPGIIENDGKYIIIGEAASAHHAWVVGALESAVRGVYQFLVRHSQHNKACANAVLAYNRREIAEPFGPLPAEFSRPVGVDYIKVPISLGPGLGQKGPVATQGAPAETAPPTGLAPEGDFARLGLIFEMIRKEQGGDVLQPESVQKKQLFPILEAGTAL